MAALKWALLLITLGFLHAVRAIPLDPVGTYGSLKDAKNCLWAVRGATKTVLKEGLPCNDKLQSQSGSCVNGKVKNLIGAPVRTGFHHAGHECLGCIYWEMKFAAVNVATEFGSTLPFNPCGCNVQMTGYAPEFLDAVRADPVVKFFCSKGGLKTVSMADAVAATYATSTKVGGGPKIPVKLGRKDAFNFDAPGPDDIKNVVTNLNCCGHLPPSCLNVQQVIDTYLALGQPDSNPGPVGPLFTTEAEAIRAAVALGVGGHSFGQFRTTAPRNPNAFLCRTDPFKPCDGLAEPSLGQCFATPFDATPVKFDNAYIAQVLQCKGAFDTDNNFNCCLADKTGCEKTQPLLRKYYQSPDKLAADFKWASERILQVGIDSETPAAASWTDDDNELYAIPS